MITLLKLYWPLAIAFIALVGILLVKAGTESAQLRLRPFGLKLIEFDLPLKSTAGIRFCLLGVALTSFGSLGLLDYSSFFPSSLEMEVFFDEQGIEETLSGFPRADLTKLNIPSNYQDLQIEYYQSLNEGLNPVLAARVDFWEDRDRIHSEGRTSFIVEKQREFLRYAIVESKGVLHHVLERPGEPPIYFQTSFEKQSSRFDYLQASIGRTLSGRGYLLRPRFKQILPENDTSQQQIFHHAVIGATHLKIFPRPHIGNTVYLADFGERGLVPIAYAVYK